MRVPLYPDRGLTLSPNSVLHVRTQISTERPPPIIVVLIRDELPIKGLLLVVDIPHKYFAARRSIHAVLHVDHVTHFGGISPPDWQTIP